MPANRNYLLLFIGLCYFSSVNPQESKDSQRLDVYTESLPPYQMLSNDQIVGVATTRVEALLEEAGLPYKLHLVPWARAYNAVNQQSHSLIYSMLRSAEREQQFQWLAVVAKVKNCFVSLADSDVVLTSISDIAPYVTGVIRNGYAHSFLLEHGFVENKHLFVLATTEDQLHLLLAKKIDLLFIDRSIVETSLTDAGLALDTIKPILCNEAWEGSMYLAANLKMPASVVERIKSADQRLLGREGN